MEHSESSSVVARTDVAAFLTDPARSRFLLPFLARERTVSEVARELNMPVGTVFYRVEQMLALELLQVSQVQRRSGRAIRHYRSAADAFFVPFALMPFESLEVQITALESRSQDRFTRALSRALLARRAAEAWGTVIYRHPQSGPTVESARAPGSPAAQPEDELALFSTWATVRLTREAAQALSQQMWALADTIVNGQAPESSAPQHPEYMVHLGFVGPTQDEA